MWRFTLALLVACAGEDEPKDKADDTDEPVDLDLDDDGYEADDCDDTNPAIHPDGVEIAYDGVDQDCAAGDMVDVDEDGFDAEEVGGPDCDDTEAEVNPDGVEVAYDDIDQDCSGEDLTDLDGDGSGIDDCNDADPTISPDVQEIWYDGIDQNCRGDCDYDADRDDALNPDWISAVVDGDLCDRDPGPEIGVVADCDDTDPNASTQAVLSFEPPDGTVDVDAMGIIYVNLRDNEMTAQIRLVDADGNEVPAVWYPEQPDRFAIYGYDPISGTSPWPLPGYTELTVEIAHSCATESSTFTTGPGLEPVVPDDLVGTTWDFTTNGIGYPCWTVLNHFGWQSFGLLSVIGSDGVDLDVRFAAIDNNGQQDLCVPTGELAGADFSNNPSVLAGPWDYPLTYGGGGPFFHQAGSISATIYDGRLLGVTLMGFVETTEVMAEAGLAANTVCNMFGCVQCPDGSGPTCYEETYWFFGDPVPQVPIELVERTAEDIAVDPGCP